MIDFKEITDGKWDNKKVWICDYRWTDYNKKAARKIFPKQVYVKSNNDNPSKRIYYSNSHFQDINKDGKALKSKVTVPFDTTGYRSYAGIPLNAFETEEECKLFFRNQVREAVKELVSRKQSVTERFDTMLDSLNDLL